MCAVRPYIRLMHRLVGTLVDEMIVNALRHHHCEHNPILVATTVPSWIAASMAWRANTASPAR